LEDNKRANYGIVNMTNLILTMPKHWARIPDDHAVAGPQWFLSIVVLIHPLINTDEII